MFVTRRRAELMARLAAQQARQQIATHFLWEARLLDEQLEELDASAPSQEWVSVSREAHRMAEIAETVGRVSVVPE